jgi:hypothetical protein
MTQFVRNFSGFKNKKKIPFFKATILRVVFVVSPWQSVATKLNHMLDPSGKFDKDNTRIRVKNPYSQYSLIPSSLITGISQVGSQGEKGSDTSANVGLDISSSTRELSGDRGGRLSAQSASASRGGGRGLGGRRGSWWRGSSWSRGFGSSRRGKVDGHTVGRAPGDDSRGDRWETWSDS